MEIDWSLLESFLNRELSSDCSGHGISHAKRVEKNALKIASAEGGDLDLIRASALLHDTIDPKIFADVEGQKEKARSILLQAGFSREKAEQILLIMEAISFRKGKEAPLASIESKVVRDADRLDALGAIGIVRTVEYGASKGRPFYHPEDLKSQGGHETSLSHFYDKLLKLEGLMCTKKGKRMAKSRAEFLRVFLREFYSEIAE